jgi:hypothetical protein
MQPDPAVVQRWLTDHLQVEGTEEPGLVMEATAGTAGRRSNDAAGMAMAIMAALASGFCCQFPAAGAGAEAARVPATAGPKGDSRGHIRSFQEKISTWRKWRVASTESCRAAPTSSSMRTA